ncbi:hypothetical protein EIP91_008210 [Steccherinum ochraceum]|uniref:Uncharacterized protein n=1 Tax=Steccherinum ochraceum TaxID=92696 RepID=A0A4R0RSH7_9APHY|nr:hypothetical protein EIP91_008210 [Steccherinum ochraceum]
MLSSSRSSFARVAQGRVVAARRVARVRTVQRFQSTSTTGSPSSASTHLAAGIAGGGVVILGAYAYYHFSGAKKAVDAAKATKAYFDQTAQTIKEKAPKNPNEAVAFLRSVAKSYLGMVPGASTYVDTTFDTLDELQETHGDEVNKIVSEAYNEVQAILKDAKSGADLETAKKLWEVLGKRIMQLQELSKKAGGDAFAKLEQKHPQVAQVLGLGYRNLKDLSDRSGPEAKKLYDETSRQLKQIFSKGFSQDALDQARDLVQSKSSQIRDLAQQASQKAWDTSLSKASAYLDKLPEIKQLLSDNASKFVSAGVSSAGVASDETKEVFDKVKEVSEVKDEGKRKEKIKELKEFVSRKAEEAQERGGRSLERGWESLQEWMKMVPGGSEAMEKVPDVKVFVELSRKKSDEARKLAKETYEDVFRVLEEKAKKARGMVEDTKNEAEKKSSS